MNVHGILALIGLPLLAGAGCGDDSVPANEPEVTDQSDSDSTTADGVDASDSDGGEDPDNTDVTSDADVIADEDTLPPSDVIADADVQLDADVEPEPDVPPDAEVDPDPDIEPDSDVALEPIGCVDLNCTDEGRACVESDGTADAECGDCLAGLVELAGECVEPSAAAPGDACTSDIDCPEGTWCSTVEGFERCSPRLFPGESFQMDFVFIPAGTFEQGTPDATDDERPYTATITRNYFVSRPEVTQGQWKAATDGINPSCFQSISGSTCTTDNNNDDGPVERVDWYAALAYANWLSNQHGLQPCYELTGCADPTAGWHDGAHTSCTDATFSGLDCTGYRLLTESEWERAARGGTTTTYYWGEATDEATVGQHAWFVSNSGRRSQEVGQKVMNAYGLFDVIGNISEWVWDWYLASYPTDPASDYIGSSAGTGRCSRGSSSINPVAGLYSAYRNLVDPADRASVLGFRLARTVP